VSMDMRLIVPLIPLWTGRFCFVIITRNLSDISGWYQVHLIVWFEEYHPWNEAIRGINIEVIMEKLTGHTFCCEPRSK
jgi:hypothetical protein